MDPYETLILGHVTRTNHCPVHIFGFTDPVNCPIYQHIIDGKKTVDGRKNKKEYHAVAPGDTVLLSDSRRGILECRVTFINKYQDVKEYLLDQGLDKTLGKTITDFSDAEKVYEQFAIKSDVDALREMYGYGFLGIGIRFVHEYKRHRDFLNEPWFSEIKCGRKTVEGRLKKSWIKTLNPYDMITFERAVPVNQLDESKKSQKNIIQVLVTSITLHPSFIDLFDTYDIKNILPGKSNYDQGVGVYRQWYSEDAEKNLGVVGICVKIIE